MSKYVIELGEDVKILQSINVTQYGNAYTNTELVGNLKELNSDYINEHYGSLQDEAYQKGHEEGRNVGIKDGMCEAWEAARKIADMWTRIDNRELLAVFGITERIGHSTINTLFGKQTASQAIAKLKAYEEKQKADDSIKAGDELRQVTDSGAPTGLVCTVTYFDGETMSGFAQDGRLVVCSSQVSRWWEKTGRHHDIDPILEAMKNG